MGDVSNILVTGATGYLGTHLVNKLIKTGYNIIILKRDTSILPQSFSGKQLATYNTNEADIKKLFEVEHIDAIIHTAASYGRKGENIIELYNANLSFPIMLLDYAIKYTVKYFFYTNTSLPPSLNLYALSKNQFSDILKANSDKIYVFDIKLEYFYGPNDGISKFVSFILSKIKAKASTIDLSHCIQVRDFIYIEDVVTAYLILIKNANNLTGYQSIPLGSGEGISLKRLTEKIKQIYNSDIILNFGALELRKEEVMYSVADISFLKNLGFKPKFNIDEGLKETIKTEKTS